MLLMLGFSISHIGLPCHMVQVYAADGVAGGSFEFSGAFCKKTDIGGFCQTTQPFVDNTSRLPGVNLQQLRLLKHVHRMLPRSQGASSFEVSTGDRADYIQVAETRGSV
jgi:hypothetical protein